MIRINQLSYHYPGSENAALRIDHLEIREGEFCLVVGPSGSGKTTLLRLLNGLIPHFTGGIVSGEIEVAGKEPVIVGPQSMSQEVGFVFQEVENQFVVDRVEDEIAFSMEQAGIPRPEMRNRVTKILQQLNLEHLKHRKVDSLSGGETQRIAIAAALVLEPQILVLDEPTSQLDPLAAEEVMQLLKKLQVEQGLTIILSEQRLDRVLGFADSVLLLSADGHLIAHGKPEEVILKSNLKPPVVELAQRMRWSPIPVNVEQAKKHVSPTIGHTVLPATTSNTQIPILKVQGLDVSLGKRKILSDIHLALFEHERLVLMGPNGAGKSTLLRTLVGLVEPDHGEVLIKGRKVIFQRTAELSKHIGFLPQDPNALLFAETVQRELETTLNNHQIPIEKGHIDHLLSQLSLSAKAMSYPRDLSTGEKQRVALGTVVVTQPDIIILDEPTRGLDQQTKNALLTLLRQWNQNGKTFLLVTHDVEFAAGFASRVLILEDGNIIDDGEPPTVLRSNPRYTPQIAQIYPETNWLTINDVTDG